MGQEIKYYFLDKETVDEIKQVLSFKETNVELAHRQQLIESLYRIYNLSLKEIQELSHTPSTTEGEKELGNDFKRYMVNARNKFVEDITRQKWNTEMRTSAEDFIICFDQMRERLINPQ